MPLARTIAPIALLMLSACQSDSEPVAPDPAYIAEIESWRAARDERLRDPDGWLSLAGLYWLEEGPNGFGSAPTSMLVFPPPALPRMGVLHREGSEVRLELEHGVTIRAGGEPVEAMPLAADSSGDPTVLEYENLSFYVIERGPRVGIRLKDRESELLASFEGMESFPVEPSWRLTGRFVPYDEPKSVQVPNIIGDTFEAMVPGEILFSAGGRELRLEPTGDPAESLFLVFGDETNGDGTYGGGRFLYTDPPAADGTVIVDFNKAYNPPCVFTPYATCPLPRRENKLAVRIEAGEKSFTGGH